MLLGAIDVGTNSIHLIVVELDPRFGTSRTILKAREMVRLGGGEALARGHLSKKAIGRGVAAIAKFTGAARAAGAREVRAVATSAVREASNRDEFLAAVRATSGIEVEVLDDVEEARLIHLGVSHGFPLADRVACIFDIGGGSTEFIVGDSDRAYFLHSVRLGSLRLYEEYLRDESAGALGYKALEKHVRALLAPVAHQLADYRFDTLIGTSGTVLGLAALDAADSGLPSQRAHGYVLRLERLRALQRTMSRLSPAERRKMPGMNPRRSDIIVAGNAIVIAALEALGRDQLVVSERALREGIVVDYLERNLAVARKLGDERTRRLDAAHALARRFGRMDVHENHVAGLALQLFDQLREVHRFEPAERDVLFAAALVHDVGMAISPSAHHKHSAYIVRNGGLPGWRAEEVDLIAALVRYHRKSLPKPTHPEWADASPATRLRIEGLGGILRLADGLDRRHLGVVSSLTVAVRLPQIAITLAAAQDVTSELGGARFKSDLFERAFGVTLTFDAVARASYDSAFGDSEPTAAEIDAASLSG
jgi:exopolyphosphatase/guanosine-5'-triphosphate,3'-diphosphate pyrophosphatase